MKRILLCLLFLNTIAIASELLTEEILVHRTSRHLTENYENWVLSKFPDLKKEEIKKYVSFRIATPSPYKEFDFTSGKDPFKEKPEYKERIKRYLRWNPDQAESPWLPVLLMLEELGVNFCDIEGSSLDHNGQVFIITNTEQNIELARKLLTTEVFEKAEPDGTGQPM